MIVRLRSFTASVPWGTRISRTVSRPLTGRETTGENTREAEFLPRSNYHESHCLLVTLVIAADFDQNDSQPSAQLRMISRRNAG